MKKLLLLSCAVILTGCFSAPNVHQGEYNAVIPLGNREVGIFIPDSWEKLQLPNASENVVLLARNGSQNVALSLEEHARTTNGESLCNAAQSGFNLFTKISVTEDKCEFQGRVGANTPMRNFMQKIVKDGGYDYFLLASCSQESRTENTKDCDEILNSFRILDKK